MTPQPQQFEDDGLAADQRRYLAIVREAARLDPAAHARDAEKTKIDPRHRNQYLEASRRGYYLTSLHNPAKRLSGGIVVLASCWRAAEAIVDGTHRLAEDDEIRVYDEEHRHRREAAARLALKEV